MFVLAHAHTHPLSNTFYCSLFPVQTVRPSLKNLKGEASETHLTLCFHPISTVQTAVLSVGETIVVEECYSSQTNKDSNKMNLKNTQTLIFFAEPMQSVKALRGRTRTSQSQHLVIVAVPHIWSRSQLSQHLHFLTDWNKTLVNRTLVFCAHKVQLKLVSLNLEELQLTRLHTQNEHPHAINTVKHHFKNHWPVLASLTFCSSWDPEYFLENSWSSTENTDAHCCTLQHRQDEGLRLIEATRRCSN